MNEIEKYCQIAVPGPKGKLLEYLPPANFPVDELLGRRVQVSIGSRTAIGIVVNVHSINPGINLRQVEEVIDTKSPSIPHELLLLTKWISDYYMCDWVDVLRASIPSGLLISPTLIVEWIGSEFEGQWPDEIMSNRKLLKLSKIAVTLKRTTSSQLAKQAKIKSGINGLLKRLVEHDLVKLTDKQNIDRELTSTVEIVTLNEEVDVALIPSGSKAKHRMLDFLKECGGKGDWSTIRTEVKIQRSTLNSLVDSGHISVKRVAKDIFTPGFDPRSNGEDTTEPPLAADQSDAVETVRKGINGTSAFEPFLLTGVPGTGKTRVYIEILKEVIAKGKGAILLTPEIGLTPQVVARIRNSIDQPVVVLHSGLTTSQRVAAWRDVIDGKTKVVVGPRSAIFAPVKDLGLIVVDEEHEDSYKQQDPSPRYHARDVALVRGKQTNSKVILVSATPSLETIRLVQEGGVTPLKLNERFGSAWPEIKIVDRRRESFNAPYISTYLADAIEKRAEKNEGTVLLHTRRGYAPVLVCNDCGALESCPNCEISLTYHSTFPPALKCHLCGYSKRQSDRCNSCNSNQLNPMGAGTQRIEDELNQRFEDLNPVRMDSDTTRKRGAHEKILKSFASGETKLLLGTQVVAKGHDFDHVTLVGVVNADPSLYQPDFRASERSFRLLVQAAGRAGRGETPGEMVIQTLSPENPIFEALEKPDIDGFMADISQQREILDYPPFSRVIMLTVLADKDSDAEEMAEFWTNALDGSGSNIRVRGPVPAYVNRVKRKYRWRIMLSSKRESDPSGSIMRRTLKNILETIPPNRGVTYIVDVDPLEVS
jgi:primosomal protein N' (replication factor Y) (superfamily II helicase)